MKNGRTGANMTILNLLFAVCDSDALTAGSDKDVNDIKMDYHFSWSLVIAFTCFADTPNWASTLLIFFIALPVVIANNTMPVQKCRLGKTLSNKDYTMRSISQTLDDTFVQTLPF